MEKWPKNPLDIIIAELKKDKYKALAIADFGCGEGRLQLDLENVGHTGKIHSFDAGKTAEHVIQCDIAEVPIPDKSVDIGVFSLSLMGTNYTNFIREANRVLKPHGKLFIAEVLSRFPDVNLFIQHMRSDAGFRSLKVNKLKDFFYVMVFEKEQDNSRLRLTPAFAE